MNYIWSPWRMDYIMNHEPSADCVFCKAPLEQDNPNNLIVFRGQAAFVILNRYPYTSGHLMIVPYAHVSSIEDLPGEVTAEMMALAAFAVHVLREVYHAQGFNIGINMGEVAGAGIANHVHMHVVPRWSGDTNFMTAISETRVLPESLEDTYARIQEQWLLSSKKGTDE